MCFWTCWWMALYLHYMLAVFVCGPVRSFDHWWLYILKMFTGDASLLYCSVNVVRLYFCLENLHWSTPAVDCFTLWTLSTVPFLVLFIVDDMQKRDIVHTKTYKLKSKIILHINAETFSKDWKAGIELCLQEAETLGISSLAMPALGTGMISHNCSF